MFPNKLYIVLLLLASCRMPDEHKDISQEAPDTTSIRTSESYTANGTPPTSSDKPLPLPVPKKIKMPSGIYQAQIPADEKTMIEQTIAFHKDLTFQLQEKYNGTKKDSIVVTEGNWSPSDGYIWLYKDQVVRGRYIWKGDTLQWSGTGSGKNYSMHSLKDAMENQVWLQKKNEGLVLFGIGNEPFWSVSISNADSISFLLSDWTKPVTLKIDSTQNREEGATYLAGKDSFELRLTVQPYFCTDGMSDYVYRNKIKVQYGNQVYHGCGIVYQ